MSRLVIAGGDLDLSHMPPLGSPWGAVQVAAQQWQTDPKK
jgi:hypothetical protein